LIGWTRELSLEFLIVKTLYISIDMGSQNPEIRGAIQSFDEDFIPRGGWILKLAFAGVDVHTPLQMQLFVNHRRTRRASFIG
jgi:hypothetical protein